MKEQLINCSMSRERPHVIGMSVLASCVGYMIGTAAVIGLSLSPFGACFGTLLDWRMVIVFSAIGNFFGWIVFLLPFALCYRRRQLPSCRACIYLGSVVVGTVIAATLTLPLKSYRSKTLSMRDLYVFGAAVSAVSSTHVLLKQRRDAMSRE